MYAFCEDFRGATVFYITIMQKNDNTAGMRLPGSIAKTKENKRM